MEITVASLFLFIFVFVGTKCKEVFYIPKITDSVFSCENFENKMLDCSGLVLGSTKGEEGEKAAQLGGQVVTEREITSDFDVELDIWKILDIADEYMYNTRANFCASLQDEDTPWYPVIQSMNISSCPIPISVFEVKDMSISLDCVKDVMCHDFCGQYRIQLSFMNLNEKLSCHTIEICIVEEEVQE